MKNYNNEDINSDLLNKREITTKPCVYFLFNDDEVVYVGQTTNLCKRIEDHKSNKIFNSYTYQELLIEELNEVETYYILTILPKYNITVPTKRKLIHIKEILKNYGISWTECTVPKIFSRMKEKCNMDPIYFNGEAFLQESDFGEIIELFLLEHSISYEYGEWERS